MHDRPHDFSVFWQPGCSSCVRVKEFLTRLEIPFNSVNVLSDSEGRNELRRLGGRSIPIVSKGDAYTYAQSIEDVAQFVDRMDAVTDRLAPEILFSKWSNVLNVALAFRQPALRGHCADQINPRPRFQGRILSDTYWVAILPDIHPV